MASVRGLEDCGANHAHAVSGDWHSREPGDAETVSQFIAHGVQEVFTTPAIAQFLAAESAGLANAPLRIATGPLAIGERSEGFTLYPLDGVVGRPAKGAGALHLAGAGVLFAGPLVVNGPRASLPGSNTEAWVEILER